MTAPVSAPMLTQADRELLRPFRLGLLAVAIAFVLLGGLLAAYGSGADRPAGVAERWLSDVGDLRRDGVRGQAERRVEEVGSLALAELLLPAGPTDGRAAFVDLEVGRAAEERTGQRRLARVPFRVHQRIEGRAGPPVDGTVVLLDAPADAAGGRGDRTGWRVVAVELDRGGLELPSEGGPPAAQAGPGFFLGAIAVGLVLAVVTSMIVRAAGPDPRRPGGRQGNERPSRDVPASRGDHRADHRRRPA